MKGLPLKLKVAAFAIGGYIAKTSPEAASKALLFILAVASVIIKATPQKADDAVLAMLRPVVEEIAALLKGLKDDD